MNEVIVVRIFDVDTDEVSYEIRNENHVYVADSETLEEAIQEAFEFAEAHNIEFIKVQVSSESSEG